MITDFKIYERKSIIKIYCDMDGVLTDFHRMEKEMFLNQWNKDHNTNIKSGWEFEDEYSSKRFWNEIKKCGIEFWSEMHWTKDGKYLWNFLQNYDNVNILSKPSRDPLSKKGKIIWCQRELGIKPILSFNKKEYANEKSILIDDLEKNINEWEHAGGIGILHKNTKDTIKELKKYMLIG